MKKFIAMFVAIIMMMVFFTACEDASMSAEYNDYDGSNIYDESTDYTGYYNYARYDGSDDIIKISSCVKYLDKDTGLWMYKIGANGTTYRVEYYAISLYTEHPGEEWDWKD